MWKKFKNFIRVPSPLLFGGAAVTITFFSFLHLRNGNPLIMHRWRHYFDSLEFYDPDDVDAVVPYLDVGSCSIQGHKGRKEEFVAIPKDENAHLYSFSIFDGYRGGVSAETASEKFPEILHSVFNKHLEKGPVDNFIPVLREAYAKTHQYIIESNPTKDPADGTSALICAFYKNALWLASYGESMAVMSRNTYPLTLNTTKLLDRYDKTLIQQQDVSEESKSKSEENKQTEVLSPESKLQELTLGYMKGVTGSFGLNHKVELAVNTRVSKERGLGEIEGIHTGVYDGYFTSIRLSNQDQFVILGSDGFWGVVNPKEIVETVLHFSSINDHITAEEMARMLTYMASQKNSKDNISTIVISFIQNSVRLKRIDVEETMKRLAESGELDIVNELELCDDELDLDELEKYINSVAGEDYLEELENHSENDPDYDLKELEKHSENDPDSVLEELEKHSENDPDSDN